MPNITLSKILTAVSSQAVGTVSSAPNATVTINTSNFSTQRRLSFWSSLTALSSLCQIKITGTREGGATIYETITPSTVVGTPNVTTQDFLSVSGVTVISSTLPLATINIGLSSIGSTPWQIANSIATPFDIGFNLVYGSSFATLTGSVDYTLVDPMPVFFGQSSWVPTPLVSTAISTTGVSTAGHIDFPITAWRFTINSTGNSSNVTIYAVPAGIGS